MAGGAASPALCSFFEKFTPRRSASAWSPASRMMYHIGFRPEGVFTAPLNRGRVIVPLGVPAGIITLVRPSIGFVYLPHFIRRARPPTFRFLVRSSAGGIGQCDVFPP